MRVGGKRDRLLAEVRLVVQGARRIACSSSGGPQWAAPESTEFFFPWLERMCLRGLKPPCEY